MTPVDRFFVASDGLRLHALDFPAADDATRLPVVCLAGLTRSARDFEPLGVALATRSATPRRVIAIDCRGRGDSDHDPDWRHYDLATERADILGILAELGVRRAHVVGTSRGGLHILGLATEHSELIRSAVFNDIGPVIEPAGLSRIKNYVGRSAAPRGYAEAIDALRRTGGRHFEGLTPEEWRFFAETTFGRDEAALGPRYDLSIAHCLDAFDLDRPLPDQWALFDRLAGTPILAIRGGNSDLLSPATVTAMGSRWPGCETWTVVGQGHAPLLADAATIARIDRFLAAAD